MKCKKAYQHIIFEISNPEFEKHLKECPSCKSIDTRVNHTMSILDHSMDVPEGMIEAILKKKRKLGTRKVGRWGLSGYVQLTAAILLGIFMGYMLGKNANTGLLFNKHKSFNKYYEIYHLNPDYSKFDFHSL